MMNTLPEKYVTAVLNKERPTVADLQMYTTVMLYIKKISVLLNILYS